MRDPVPLSFTEFVAWESRQEAKHEFVDGQIVAFAGGTVNHARIAGNVLAALVARLRGGPCIAMGSDILVETARGGRYTDVVVSCDAKDLAGANRLIRSPKLIVEVLSESTAALDQTDKRDEYLALPTLEEYALIDSRKRWVLSYRRHGTDWVVSLPKTSGPFSFDSVGVALSFDDLYGDAVSEGSIQPG